MQVQDQGFIAVLAVLRLSLRYGPARLEAACRFAPQGHLRSPRYAHLRPLLGTGQDKGHGALLEPIHNEGGYAGDSDYYAGGTR